MTDELDKLKLADYWLGQLLACLHADGGHYQGTHGTEKAAQDAISAHYEKIMALGELRVERDGYRAALGRIANQWAQPARDIARLAIAEADKDKPRD